MNILCRWYLRCLMKNASPDSRRYHAQKQRRRNGCLESDVCRSYYFHCADCGNLYFSSKHFMSGMTAGAVKG